LADDDKIAGRVTWHGSSGYDNRDRFQHADEAADDRRDVER
jgi:hypothetical protein